MVKKKATERKGKKHKKKSKRISKSSFYEIKGESVSRKKRNCPKCGLGVFLAEHKNRLTCGCCGYTEMKA